MSAPGASPMHSRAAPRGLGPGGAGRNSGRRSRSGGTRGDLLSVTLPAWRSKLMLFSLFCAFGALTLRVVYLQGGWTTGFLQR